MKNCVKCLGLTKYICLKCAKPLCKWKECSVPADEAPSQPDGCQRKCLALKEKVKIIQKSDEGNSSRKLAQMFDCGKTQIVKILKQKATILESWNSNEGTQSQKRLNVKKYVKINSLLWEWYTRARASNIPVDGPMHAGQRSTNYCREN